MLLASWTLGGPYEAQVNQQIKKLGATAASVRAGAAEALGFLRGYAAASSLIQCLQDADADVRREAAMALGWCGGRKAVPALLSALADEDWVVRQAAHVALTNLTGMEFPFDALTPAAIRKNQAGAWRDWWRTVPEAGAPDTVLALIQGPGRLQDRWPVQASSVYKGPPSVLRDGLVGPRFWQTKQVAFPQWCTIDLGKEKTISHVTVHQYGAGFVMTEYAVSVSLDNKTFKEVVRKKERTQVKLVVRFPAVPARYVRITSFGTVNRTYPTTFFEVQVDGDEVKAKNAEDLIWQAERGYRALGVLGGEGASQLIIDSLGDPLPTAVSYYPMMCAAIRALGRLKEPAGYDFLVALLDNTFWARRAAEALGDFGDARAIPALLAAYDEFAKHLNQKDPRRVPRDDKMGFPSEDRMLETPYWIAFALSRLSFDAPAHVAFLRKRVPRILANLPGDHDTFMLYEEEVGHALTRHLLTTAGMRQEACEQVFGVLGLPRRVPPPAFLSKRNASLAWPAWKPRYMAALLPAVCTEKADLPRLTVLLGHKDGWVRLNAAKAMAWLGEPKAIAVLAEALRQAKPEGAFGFSGTFKDEEFNDPAPRWREGVIRAMGLLKAHEQTGLIVEVLNDDDSVLEVRYAAAEALADLGNPQALAGLKQAASGHPFMSVRRVARDALRFRGLDGQVMTGSVDRPSHASAGDATETLPAGETAREIPAIVFIKGDNNIPNTIGTVEQADRWRQTYVVTDSGPAYRPGRNLYILKPPRPDGKVTPLTRFADGFVAEPEVSWDGKQVIFTRRGRDDPWWQIYRIGVDGKGLTQLTRGPFHHVGPAFLPDGRIVLSSSRSGIRDEYHGYPCTSLHVMEPDGSGLREIATNIGRDNEPAVLWDGRIVFSRLEVFYSRNKTELTLHAVHPDGTQDVVLYGPERRAFWRQLNHGPRTPADGQENPLTHRVTRMTQPQPMPDGRHIVVATQGGLILVGPQRDAETFISPDNLKRAYTTPFPLADGRIMCASTLKESDRKKVDLGLYCLDPETQALTLIYNDPKAADFEARPIIARRPPPKIRSISAEPAYSGSFFCSSAFTSQEKHVAERGRLVRLIEGVPVLGRHSTHTNEFPVWQNHGGTFARVLGTAPLRADGSFHVEAPADRLMHFQILDSNRRVLGNQLTWIYTRPGEQKSCVGCHEDPHATPKATLPRKALGRPIDFLPQPDNFKYRAKAWFKGHLPAIIEERTRTVRSVNLFGR